MTEYIVVGRSNGTTRMGSPYCSLKIKNNNEELTVAVWDVAPNDPPVVGHLVSFAYMQNNDGKCSAHKSDLRPGMIDDDSHPLYGLIPRPITRQEWDTTIANLMTMCSDERLKTTISDVAAKLFQPYSQYRRHRAYTTLSEEDCSTTYTRCYTCLKVSHPARPTLSASTTARWLSSSTTTARFRPTARTATHSLSMP